MTQRIASRQVGGYHDGAPLVALLYRLTHHVHILEMNGDSYRLKRSRQSAAYQVSDEPEDP